MKSPEPVDVLDSRKSPYHCLGIVDSFYDLPGARRSSCVTLYSDMRIDELKLIPVWLSSQHLVSTAKYVMDGHRLKAMGIVDEGMFVGIVRRERVASGQGADRVAGVVEEPVLAVESNMRIEQAAELFVEHDLDYAPVLEEGRFLGMLTSNILLKELRQSRDPLTGLPWSDRLREWGIDRLREGKEITIIFFDLDDFGIYNKRFGHIIGDRVLQFFSNFLKTKVDQESEVLVRYGGDEFAICTFRAQKEVYALLKEFGASIQEDDSDPVHFSVGVSGGRRTIERENIHFAATIDNLINLASRDCQRNKRPKTAAVMTVADNGTAATTPSKSISVVSVHDAKKQVGSLTTVILSTGNAVFSGIYSRSIESVHQSIALATCQALTRIYTDGHLTIDEVYHEERDDGERYITVVGHLMSADVEVAVSAVEVVDDDVSLAIAKATIAAFASSGLAMQ